MHFRYLILLLILASCEIQKRDNKEGKHEENFDAFYNNFVNDSSFQISRIKFPVKGYYMDNDVAGLDSNGNEYTGDYVWTSENWTLIKKIPDEYVDQAETSTKQNGDTVIRLTKGKDFSFYFEEKFIPIERKWHLIYLKDESF